MLKGLLKGSKSKRAKDAPLLPEGVRLYAIGDIHGRADLLEKLFAQLRADIKGGDFNQLHFVFLGDYIDRGFQSREVIEIILSQEWGALKPTFLLGNHEKTLLDFLDDPSVGPSWMEYGGRETLSSYGVELQNGGKGEASWRAASEGLRAALPVSHLNFLRSLKLSFVLGECYFVHAGVNPDRPVADQSEDDQLWIRDRFLESRKRLEKVIVHGHTPETSPVWDGRRIGVDTGAYITNRLTAVRIEGGGVDFISTN